MTDLLKKLENSEIKFAVPKMATGTIIPIGVWLKELELTREENRHKEILERENIKQDELLDLQSQILAEIKKQPVKKPQAKSRKAKIPAMPKTKSADAYKWVLAWEKIKVKVDDDPTLKLDLRELQDWLKSHSIQLGEQTLKKIIKAGNAGKIPTRADFERKNKI